MALPKPEAGKSEQEILDAAEEAMQVLGGDPSADKIIPDNEEVDADDLEEVDEDAEEEEEVEEDTEEEEGEESEEEEGEEEEAAEEGGDDEGPQLTDAYYRAAVNGGYDEKEIVEFMKANPELAIKTFSKMHDQMNSVSQEFANIGRYKKEQANKPAEEPASKPGFKKIDLEQLQLDDPDNPLIGVLGQMQEQSEAMFNELEKRPAQSNSQLVTDQDKLADDQAAVIGQKIDSFFRAPGMEAFAVTYGALGKDAKDWTGLMPSEKMNRVAVIELVEEQISGAKALGKELGIEDALDRAHLLITQPIREKMIRKDIMDKVRKRSKSMTLKPNSKSPTSAPKKAKTSKDVIANTEERLAAIKW
jgi:hypothetical protein